MNTFNGRRKLLAKNLMDASKIIIAAMFASEFFTKFPFYAKIVMYIFLVTIAIGAFFVHPKGED
jgi:hypothetical protein